jgi:hypothetical protein
VPVVQDERLREREFGVLDGLTRKGITAQFASESERRALLGKFYHRPPGGESWSDVLLRLRAALDEMRLETAGERVVLVGHQVVVLLVRYVLERMTEQQILDIDREAEVANCSLTTYRTTPAPGCAAGWCWSATTRSGTSAARTKRSPPSRTCPVPPADPVAVTPRLLREWALPEPDDDGGKHERGSVLVLGGASSTPGAVLLAGLAALRVGAGRLQVATVRSTAVALGVALPEAQVVGLPESGEGSVSASCADQVVELAQQADALVVGPGLLGKTRSRRCSRASCRTVTEVPLSRRPPSRSPSWPRAAAAARPGGRRGADAERR